jgi:uncharacterized protein YodC (DUF2158 family)
MTFSAVDQSDVNKRKGRFSTTCSSFSSTQGIYNCKWYSYLMEVFACDLTENAMYSYKHISEYSSVLVFMLP